MTMHVRRANTNDAAGIASLLADSFTTFVAPGWGSDAIATFHAENTAEKLVAKVAAATYAGVHEIDHGVAGVILLPRPTLVQLCFVAPAHIGKGVGRALWEAARAHLEANFPEVKTVELNASPYAVPAYRAMGFFPISKQYRKGGWVATRMACWLPDRELPSANAA